MPPLSSRTCRSITSDARRPRAGGWRVRAAAGSVALLAAAGVAPLAAQCRPPASSNEARLLAFYESPIAFSPASAPTPLAPGAVVVGVEVVPVPTPDPSIEQTGLCYRSKVEDTRLAPVFGRPRVTIGLPAGLQLEASYVPPVTVSHATPNLASAALSHVSRLPTPAGLGALSLLLRAHGTIGEVRGPITCPARSLQGADDTLPCFGTSPSRDTFHPYMLGAEGALGLTTRGGRWSLYAGGGVTWLRPRFQVGFTDLNGFTDRTRVEVNLTRGVVFGGITAHLTRAVDLSAQIYDVPTDATTFRFGGEYRLRR